MEAVSSRNQPSSRLSRDDRNLLPLGWGGCSIEQIRKRPLAIVLPDLIALAFIECDLEYGKRHEFTCLDQIEIDHRTA
jgi:hypothetical protein